MLSNKEKKNSDEEHKQLMDKLINHVQLLESWYRPSAWILLGTNKTDARKLETSKMFEYVQKMPEDRVRFLLFHILDKGYDHMEDDKYLIEGGVIDHRETFDFLSGVDLLKKKTVDELKQMVDEREQSFIKLNGKYMTEVKWDVTKPNNFTSSILKKKLHVNNKEEEDAEEADTIISILEPDTILLILELGPLQRSTYVSEFNGRLTYENVINEIERTIRHLNREDYDLGDLFPRGDDLCEYGILGNEIMKKMESYPNIKIKYDKCQPISFNDLVGKKVYFKGLDCNNGYCRVILEE